MVGIYVIRNKINEKVYVGRSTDIQRRWNSHLRDARIGENSKIHIAMRDLGIENFYLEILEECELNNLNEREQYYIDLFDSWHNGYNNGNSSNFLDGEKNHNAKMKERFVYDIRYRQSLMVENRREIYEDYKDIVTWTNFLYICKYLTWVDILTEYNTEEIMNWHRKQLGNESKKFSQEQLIEILNLYYKKKMPIIEIAKMYNKHRKTISRLLNGIYYKKEIDELRKSNPFLFQS